MDTKSTRSTVMGMPASLDLQGRVELAELHPDAAPASALDGAEQHSQAADVVGGVGLGRPVEAERGQHLVEAAGVSCPSWPGALPDVTPGRVEERRRGGAQRDLGDRVALAVPE